MKCKKLKKKFEELVQKAKELEQRYSGQVNDFIFVRESEIIFVDGKQYYCLKNQIND